MIAAESSQPGPPGYLDTFSLRCEPFAERIDSRFFYASTTLMQRLDLLTHLTRFGDAVVLVSGPPGSGKTTLLSRFIGQANKHWRLCLIDAADEFSQFPNRLADALGSDSCSSEQELVTQWADETDSSQLLVILIDNAEQLAESALERLCALLGQACSDRIRIILFGLPEAQQRLRQTFEQKALSGSSQRLEMPRLNEEETSSYLMYRLAVAGYSGVSPFTATEVRAMCKAADGRPAGINRLASRALLERQARTSSELIRPNIGTRTGNALAWALVSLGVLSVAFYLGWQRFHPASSDAHRPGDLPPSQQGRPLVLPEPSPLPAPGQNFRVAGNAAETRPPALETPAESAEIEASRELPERAPVEQPLADTAAPSGPVVSNDEIVAVTPEPTETGAPDPDAQGRTAPPVSPAEQAPASLETVTPASSAAPAETSTKETLPHREAWLLEKPDTSFSLQLLGSRNEKSIVDYIRRHKLDEQQTAYYRGHYRGAAWYVLMYGVYPSKKVALQERETLPAEVRKPKPWPRSLKSVHASIREAQ